MKKKISTEAHQIIFDKTFNDDKVQQRSEHPPIVTLVRAFRVLVEGNPVNMKIITSELQKKEYTLCRLKMVLKQ